jgi:CheY-like chemotaxis protein
MREAMVEVLSSRGYRVLTAEDGVEALEVLALEVRAHHAPPALVVTDLQMPRLDGAGLMARMQEDADLCEVPVLVATSAPGAPPGAAGFLHKPFSLRELLAAVEGRLSSAAAPH